MKETEAVGEVGEGEEAERFDVEVAFETDSVCEEVGDGCAVDGGAGGHVGEEGAAVEEFHEEEEDVPV